MCARKLLEVENTPMYPATWSLITSGRSDVVSNSLVNFATSSGFAGNVMSVATSSGAASSFGDSPLPCFRAASSSEFTAFTSRSNSSASGPSPLQVHPRREHRVHRKVEVHPRRIQPIRAIVRHARREARLRLVDQRLRLRTVRIRRSAPPLPRSAQPASAVLAASPCSRRSSVHPV